MRVVWGVCVVVVVIVAAAVELCSFTVPEAAAAVALALLPPLALPLRSLPAPALLPLETAACLYRACVCSI